MPVSLADLGRFGPNQRAKVVQRPHAVVFCNELFLS